MTKLIKQYNKILLITLGILLMVGFLIGDTLRAFGQGGHYGPGITVAGQKISGAEIAISNARFELVRSRTPELTALIENDARANADKDSHSRAEHWLLLAHEAKRAGFTGPEQDGATFLTDEYPDLMTDIRIRQFQQQGGRPEPKDVETLRESLRLSAASLPQVAGGHTARDARLSDAAAEFKGFSRMLDTYKSLPRLSDERLNARLTRAFNRATWDYVLLTVDEATANQIPAPEGPTDLLNFFNRYRDMDAAQSDVGVGYRLPPRVKLQWLTLDAAAIRAQIKVRALDVERRLREVPAKAGEDETVRRAVVEKQLNDEQFEKILAEAELVVKGELLKVLANVRDERANGLTYKRLPDDWSVIRPDLAAIGKLASDRVNAKFSLKLDPFKVGSADTAWQTANDMRRLPGVGTASMKRDTRPFPLSEVALSLREMGPFDANNAPSFPVQLNVPLVEPLLSADGSAYYVVFTAARGASGPETLDEVADKVLADYRRVKAFESLASQSEILSAAAALEGLESVAAGMIINGKPAQVVNEVYSSRLRPNSVEPGSKMAQWMASVPDLSERILSRAEKLDPTKPIDQQDIANRVFTISVPSQRAIAIVRITGFEPLTREDYQERLAFLASTQRGDGVMRTFARQTMDAGTDDPDKVSPGAMPKFAIDPFSYSQLKDRLKVSDGRPADAPTK